MPGGAGREDYSPMPVGGSGASRGRQDREGSGYYDRPANRARLQNQQARINQMQSRGEGIFGRPAKQSFLSGIGKKFKDWAGNMRGGINPLTNEYYTQDEYEDNVQDRRDRASIDRLARTRDVGKYANDPEGWAASDLSGRLGGLEKQFGIDQPVDARGLFEQEQGGIGATNVAQDLGAPFSMEKENMLREMINNSYDRNVTSLRGDDDKIQRFSLADMGIGTGDRSRIGGINGYTAEADPYLPGLEPINTMNNPIWNPDTQQFEYPWDRSAKADDDISNLFAAEQLALPGSENWTLGSGASTSGFPYSIWDQSGTGTGASPQSWIRPTGAQGGRVGYNTGGRVGILSIF